MAEDRLPEKTIEGYQPPIRTTEQYHVDKAAGIERVGKPIDKKGV